MLISKFKHNTLRVMKILGSQRLQSTQNYIYFPMVIKLCMVTYLWIYYWHKCVNIYFKAYAASRAHLLKSFQKRFINYNKQTNKLTNYSTEENPSWKGNNCWANLDCPSMLQKTEVYYHVYEGQAMVSTWDRRMQIIPPPYFSEIHFSIILSSTSMSS